MIKISNYKLSDEDVRDVLFGAGIKTIGGVYVVGRFCVRDCVKHRETFASRDARQIIEWIFETTEDKSTGDHYRSNVIIVHGEIAVKMSDVEESVQYHNNINTIKQPGVL